MIYEPTGEEIRVATEWHGGQSSMFYAVSSTGALSRGTMRPLDCETDAEWDHDLAWQLACELRECIVLAVKQGEDDDADIMSDWLDKVNELLAELDDEIDAG